MKPQPRPRVRPQTDGATTSGVSRGRVRDGNTPPSYDPPTPSGATASKSADSTVKPPVSRPLPKPQPFASLPSPSLKISLSALCCSPQESRSFGLPWSRAASQRDVDATLAVPDRRQLPLHQDHLCSVFCDIPSPPVSTPPQAPAFVRCLDALPAKPSCRCFLPTMARSRWTP